MKHPRDISDADVDMAMAASRNPDLLRHLVQLSRATFGFYPNYFPYTLNYPWVAERAGKLPQGARVLDVGAGLSPLPLYLANRGMDVDSIDNSRHIRRLPPASNWNEWGFFDYSVLHKKLTSHHCHVASFTPTAPFDAIYSVAALAHMSRAAREDVLNRCHVWLRPEGLLLLTIDIIPSSDFIWNRSEGIEVEPPIEHGTIEDVINLLEEVGFQITEKRVMRAIIKSRTDLLLIACIKRLSSGLSEESYS